MHSLIMYVKKLYFARPQVHSTVLWFIIKFAICLNRERLVLLTYSETTLLVKQGFEYWLK